MGKILSGWRRQFHHSVANVKRTGRAALDFLIMPKVEITGFGTFEPGAV
jgi:hypothetical protein